MSRLREYALISLNTTECASIYLKKKQQQTNSAEHARILNVSDPVHSIRSLYKLMSSYRDRRTLSNI